MATTPELDALNKKVNELIDAVEEMQKNQKETTEAIAMLTDELIKLQRIVKDAAER